MAARIIAQITSFLKDSILVYEENPVLKHPTRGWACLLIKLAVFLKSHYWIASRTEYEGTIANVMLAGQAVFATARTINILFEYTTSTSYSKPTSNPLHAPTPTLPQSSVPTRYYRRTPPSLPRATTTTDPLTNTIFPAASDPAQQSRNRV